MSGFDDFIAAAQRIGDDRPLPPPRPAQWEYTTVHTDVKKKAQTLQRMSRKGWEYVEETKNPIFALRPPLALTFRRLA